MLRDHLHELDIFESAADSDLDTLAVPFHPSLNRAHSTGAEWLAQTCRSEARAEAFPRFHRAVAAPRALHGSLRAHRRHARRGASARDYLPQRRQPEDDRPERAARRPPPRDREVAAVPG